MMDDNEILTVRKRGISTYMMLELLGLEAPDCNYDAARVEYMRKILILYLQSFRVFVNNRDFLRWIYQHPCWRTDPTHLYWYFYFHVNSSCYHIYGTCDRPIPLGTYKEYLSRLQAVPDHWPDLPKIELETFRHFKPTCDKRKNSLYLQAQQGVR